MSSAILYLAIIAIWACVLIPRWLRRDPAHGASAVPPLTSEPPVPAEPDAPADSDMGAGEAGDGSLEEASADADDAPRPIPAPAPAPAHEPLSAEESRRRMLAARRRLLLMLIVLEAAAIALAYLGLAALWVVIPPSIMLIGYLLLLREAARADAERARHEAEAAAHAQAREHARARTLAARHATPADGMSAEGIAAAAALAARFAAAPVPADYEDSGPGRDFAPGLAGKYTPSNAAAEVTDEDYYSAYETSRLRAVGD
jgi:hypothetical protein